MDFNDNIIACAKLVERGDPLRFRTVMAAPLSARPVLFALYAFNLEVARAPWVTSEPMIAEMRLQWWRDALQEIKAGKPARRHEVVTPLSEVLTPQNADLLDALVQARRWDIYKDAFEDAAHFERYITETAGHLMFVAAQTLGHCTPQALYDLAYGAGMVAWLQAVPKLEGAKRIPLLDGRPDAVKALAQNALNRFENGQKNVGASKSARPALWPALGAKRVLKQVIADPHAVAQDRVKPQKAHLFWAALRG